METKHTEHTAVCLPAMKKGGRGVVVSLVGDDSTNNRLRELGLFEKSEVKVLHINGSVMCQVHESRFGIDRAIAEKVIVEPIS